MLLKYAIASLSVCVAASVTAAPMEFAEHFNGAMRIDRNSSWISAQGEITAETPAALEKFLASSTIWKDQRIVINSPGGSVLAGIQLGAIIRKHELQTAVARSVKKAGAFSSLEPGDCASACVLAFAGGVERSVVAPSRIGVHQMSIDHKSLYKAGVVSVDTLDLSFAASQILVGLTVSHFIAMGIDPSIVQMMTTKAPSEIRWLSEAELASTKIRYDPKAFHDWAIEPFKAGIVAFTKSLDGARQLTLSCSNGKMKFRLAASGGAYAMNFVSSVGDPKEIEIAGIKVPKTNFKMSDVKGGMIVSGDWSGSELPQGSRSTLSLFGEAVGAIADLYSMYAFNERGFQQSVRLVRRNRFS